MTETCCTPSWLSVKSITLHAPDDPPLRLWPVGASDGYIAARRALEDAEIALSEQAETVAAARRALPPGPLLPDYVLAEGPAEPDLDGPVRPTRLGELFGDHDTLVVYHLMFHPDDDEPCAMCAMWVDGLNGVARHLTRTTGLAVVARAPVPSIRALGRGRGWDEVRLVSSHGSTFNADLGVETPAGGQNPMISVLRRDGDGIRHVLTRCADFLNGRNRGIDLYSPVWQVLDLLPQGRGEWLPDNDYPRIDRPA
jgi:predicted dithiol-disulfide oxidoreductase (DUF899 family)